MNAFPNLTRFALLSIAAALITIGMKTGAYALTGSVGLLSDALESGVNLIAAIIAFAVLIVAAKPPDDEHAYGHEKAEYFSSGVEGALIVIAAISIAWTSAGRLANPEPIEQIGIGVAISIGASLVNLGVALILRRAGRLYRSIVLEADARHLMTDVWTSVGVVVGIILIGLTGWSWLDPVIGLLVAVNIVIAGVSLVQRSIAGLLDTALPADERQQIEAVLDSYRSARVEFHALRTRQSGARRFVSVHVLVPGAWTVQQGHNLLEQIERAMRQQLAHLTVTTHLEPIEDPIALDDRHLDRAD